MRPLRAFRAFLSTLTLLAIPVLVRAEIPTATEMETVCRNWLAYAASQPGGWGGETRPSIESSRDIRVDGRLLARCYAIAPAGNVVVPALKEMPPVKTYSEEYTFDVDLDDGFPALLRQDLLGRFEIYERTYGSLDAPQPASGPVLFDRSQRERWDRFLVDPAVFANRLASGTGERERTQVGPLLTSAWHQDAPYSNFCPMGDGGRCVVGCVATAVAQVMRFHEWPPRGLRDYQYWWDGDNSCGGQTAGQYIYADFSDEYDWVNMPDACGSCTQQQRDALAELCYEVGVAVDMDYGRCGSGAYTDVILQRLPQYFRYDDAIDRQLRNGHTPQSWFSIIQTEINNNRPMVYTFSYDPTVGHAIVCDGWRDDGGQNEYHMNYGWGGAYTAWYTIDAIYHTEDPMEERLYRRIMPSLTGTVFTIRPDGTGDYGTIQPAIDAALDGDIIELTDGTFSGTGNRDLDASGRNLTIRSKTGHPEACIIDCGGNPEDHRAIAYHSGEGAESVLEGVTIINGFASSGGGGAILCSNGSAPTIRGCVFRENCAADPLTGGTGGALACIGSGASVIECRFEANFTAEATGSGGAVYLGAFNGSLRNCVFLDNEAGRGGGVAIEGASSPAIENCTFHANRASGGGGGGVWLSTESSLAMQRSIVGFSLDGGAIACEGGAGDVSLACCDVVSNTGGDWVGCIAGLSGLFDNFSADPLYCDAPQGNLGLTAASPCTAENNPACGLVGALPVGCGSIVVRPDGSGDYPTIQAAVDAALDGYTISLEDGVYGGPGNRDIDFHGKAVRVASASGDPDSCIIDCGGSPGNDHRGFNFISGEGSGSAISGLTIRNGYQSIYSGGAIQCRNGAMPVIEHCRVIANTAGGSGGGLYAYQSTPTIRYCTFAANTGGNGGGLYLSTGGTPVGIDHCTISHNTGQYSGGGITAYSTPLTATNCIVSFNTGGMGVECFYGSATLSCCDVFGNSGGDYTGCLQGQQGVNGNLNRHPCFCDPPLGDFHLAMDSPCAPENNATCGQIGAWGIGCGVSSVLDDVSRMGLPLIDRVSPNPFREAIRLAVRVPDGGAVRIMDSAGRCVRTFPLESGAASRVQEVVWDGRDSSGNSLPSGVYFARIEGLGRNDSRALILLR